MANRLIVEKVADYGGYAYHKECLDIMAVKQKAIGSTVKVPTELTTTSNPAATMAKTAEQHIEELQDYIENMQDEIQARRKDVKEAEKYLAAIKRGNRDAIKGYEQKIKRAKKALQALNSKSSKPRNSQRAPTKKPKKTD